MLAAATAAGGNKALSRSISTLHLLVCVCVAKAESMATAPETGATKVRCGLVDVIEQCTLYVCLWVAELSPVAKSLWHATGLYTNCYIRILFCTSFIING